MAVVVTAASGYDLGYVWKNQPRRSGPERSAGGYYINAAQAGEPPGRWWGPGTQALGFADGQIVDREPYELVYRQVDPRTGGKLGRSPASYASFADHLARLTAAEPHATGERLAELERLAAQATRQTPAYTDVTVSFSKSISVFHASIRENERRARLAGDHASAGWWADAERRYQEVLQAANRAGLEYVQRHAGVTRTGYHGARVDGREPGRYAEGMLVVSSWLQGTSRDGDPQDHIHNQIARMVQTAGDGKWRALDTVSLRGVLGAVQAVVAAHAECGLSAEFGVGWVPRADGAGNEIAGISREQMDAYSSRTVAITARMPEAVASWTEKYGRAPNRRELLYIGQAVTMATREGKDPGVIDWDALTARWDARLGGALASIAPRVSSLRAPGARAASATAHAQAQPSAQPRAETAAQSRAALRAGMPGRRELTRAVQRALVLVQAEHSAWTRADLVKQLGLVLPPASRTMHPDAAVALLDRLADEALAGAGGPVACLEGPQWPPLPPSLVRDLDGGSVFSRPGSARYATRVQLAMEEELLQHARHRGAPRLGPASAAALLGASAAQLETALREGAGPPAGKATGLRLDQAAALYHALTATQTAIVLTGPAGSGKTRVLAEAARLWTETGKGPVLGIATAQAARNVLASAGVEVAENSSVFLGHLPGRRGALGIREITPGTLLLIDEASMMSIPDLADIIDCAVRRGAKVIVAGDQEQLAAVESGGGMRLLATKLGYVQLTEAVRFTAGWERDASLRLRAGDPSALDAYQEHGRIRGAAPEQALDQACRQYISHDLAGRDVLLMIADNERCAEASRRIREDLAHLGLTDTAGRQAVLAGGARASAGDLIIARENDHQTQAGEPGRTLANGDTLRIEKVHRNGALTVRRALDADPRTGQRRWTQPFTWTRCHTANLAYAITGHSAQGRTVTAGIALVTGTEDRHWLYVAMTRGTHDNTAIAFTEPARPADAQAGTRPAPELARHQRAEAERAGLPAPPPPAPGGQEPRHALGVLADVLARDSADLSALETRDRALASADHLAVLNAIWQDQTAQYHRARHQRIVAAALPPAYPAAALDTPAATWLWRTLRAAEAAGLDPAQAVHDAVASRPLTGTRDLAAVLDFRLRQVTDPLTPLPPKPWTQQVPQVPDPDLQRFLTQLAEAMDARKDRIGEHLAASPERWTFPAFGPVPADPLGRLDWQHRAAVVGAYRELYSHDDPADPIGPEPAAESPEKRAAWHAAFAALAPATAAELRALPDGALWQARAAYQAETAWAPRHTGRELARIRASASDAHLAAIRARAEKTAARHHGHHEQASRHAALARSYDAMTRFYRAWETELDQTMTLRRDWEHATRHTRQLAVAADTELRRRHPGQPIEPLCSAEPRTTDQEREQLNLTPGQDHYQAPGWITSLAAERRTTRQELSQRATGRPERGHTIAAWPAWPSPGQAAILQSPKPQIQPDSAIIHRTTGHQVEAQ